jgi:hypothetical protein
MSNEETTLTLGRKIFFLYPSPQVQSAVVDELVQREYEAYTAKDRIGLRRVLKNFPGSIIFVDIDQLILEKEWEAWIREVMKAEDLRDIRIGILTTNRNDILQNKYANMLHIPCGYTMLHRDLAVTLTQVLRILDANEAKGRRKYLRAVLENGGTINLPLNNTFVKGAIKDISAVGFSCVLDQNPIIAKNTLFQDIQIKLQSQILKVEGIVLGSRQEENGNHCYVVLFTQRVDPDTRAKIRTYIQQYFQSKMDEELK